MGEDQEWSHGGGTAEPVRNQRAFVYSAIALVVLAMTAAVVWAMHRWSVSDLPMHDPAAASQSQASLVDDRPDPAATLPSLGVRQLDNRADRQ